MVLDHALQHLKLVLVEPGETAIAAPVDLDQVCLAVESAGHGILTFWTGQERDRLCSFALDPLVDVPALVLPERSARQRGHAFGTRPIPAGARDDPRDLSGFHQGPGAEPARGDAGPAARRGDERLGAGRAGIVVRGCRFLPVPSREDRIDEG